MSNTPYGTAVYDDQLGYVGVVLGGSIGAAYDYGSPMGRVWQLTGQPSHTLNQSLKLSFRTLTPVTALMPTLRPGT